MSDLITTLSEFRAKWSGEQARAARRSEMVRADALIAEFLADVQALEQARQTHAVAVKAAAEATGLNPDSIGRMIREGRVTNHGTAKRPKVVLAELPPSRGPKTAPAGVAADAAPCETSGTRAVVGSIALDALAGRHGRHRQVRSQ